jgi:hypothetical protein
MAQAQTYYDYEFSKGLNWWFIREEIGQGLRELYEVPTELPPKLLSLVRNLDDRDWLLPSVNWQNDVDLFGGRVRSSRWCPSNKRWLHRTKPKSPRGTLL